MKGLAECKLFVNIDDDDVKPKVEHQAFASNRKRSHQNNSEKNINTAKKKEKKKNRERKKDCQENKQMGEKPKSDSNVAHNADEENEMEIRNNGSPRKSWSSTYLYTV